MPGCTEFSRMGVLLLRNLRFTNRWSGRSANLAGKSVVVKWGGAGRLPHAMPGGTTEDQSGKVEQGVPYSYGLCSRHAFITLSFLAKVFPRNKSGPPRPSSLLPLTRSPFTPSLSPCPFSPSPARLLTAHRSLLTSKKTLDYSLAS